MRPLASIVATGLIALGALAPHPAAADTHSNYVVRDGLVVFYAIVPAAQIRLYPKHGPEARMHGGVPKGPDMHHLMIALFDAGTLERIDDATVTATVAEVGLAGRRVRLEPFSVNGALTYCNYIRMARRTDYRIRIAIIRPAAAERTPVAFAFRPG